MIYTLFDTPLQSAWRGDVDDPTDGQAVGQLLGEAKQNILYRRIESLNINTAETRTINFAVSSLQAEWVYIIAKVIGRARFNIAGVDTDGSTPITSNPKIYGTEVFPGFGKLSTYNLTSINIEGLEDGTTVELFSAVACADDDSRLVTNA